MVPGEMAGRPANDRALDTAFGRSRADLRDDSEGADGAEKSPGSQASQSHDHLRW
jgi:hypothetical protein